MTKDSKELVVKPGEVTFPALVEDPRALVEAMQENMGGMALTAFDLDRIKIPSGGATTWVYEGLEGLVDTKELVGILVGVQNCRAFWAVGFDESGGGSPPDCASEDSVHGMGLNGPGSEANPTGLCADCPYSKFGSDKRNLGQGCKQILRLFLLMPDSNLPRVVALPPTSLKPARQYLLRLSSNGLKMHSAVTRITLTPDKNKQGIKYSKAVFALVAKLSQEQAQAAAGLAAALAPFFKARPVAEDFQEQPEEAF